MDLFCFKSKKKVEQHKSIIYPWEVRHKKFYDSVIQEKSFVVSKIIEYGYFGTTIDVNHNETDAQLRVRILKKDYLGENEKEWAKFNHRNLLPLLKMEFLKNADCFLFYSPTEETTLQEKVDAKIFRNDPLAHWKIIKWLSEICDALEYLNHCGFAHCNLEAKNMIVTQNDILQISQFHHLTSINSRSYRYSLPQSLRPPEAYFDGEGTWPVKSEKLDSWSVGILILELFTGSYLKKKLPKKVCSWPKQVYPVMYDVLKKYKFSRLVSKRFPKANGTVDLKSIRYLAAHALSPQPSKRPSAKELHNLFIMIDVQKKFFSKIKLEFRKDYIWRNKLDPKKLETYYSGLSIDDDLEWLREDNLRNIKNEVESKVNTRSPFKKESDTLPEDTLVKAEKENGNISKIHTNNVDGVKVNYAKAKCKKEDLRRRVLLKNQDKIKLAFSAFTCHQRSAYETSVFDITSTSSELSGEGLEKNNITTSKMDKFPERMQNNNFYSGDSSHIQEKICQNLPRKKDEETPRKMNNEKDENQMLADEILLKDFLSKINENNDNENDYLKKRTIIKREDNQADYPKNDLKNVYPKTEVSTEVEVNYEKKIQDPDKISKTIFTSGKQLINKVMKFSFDYYDMTTNSYEISSSSNYLNNLSKRLTK